MTTAPATANVQDRILGAVQQAQDTYVEFFSKVSDTVGQALPELPDPLRKRLPSARGIVDGSFDLAEKLLEANRQFAINLLDAAVPAIDAKHDAPKVKKAA